jgi:hypothetical protein
VAFSDAGFETLEARRQQALMLYQTLAMDPAIDQIKLRQYLARAFNDPEFTTLWKQGVLDANIPAQVPQVSGGGGAVLPQQQQMPQQAQVP